MSSDLDGCKSSAMSSHTSSGTSSHMSSHHEQPVDGSGMSSDVRPPTSHHEQ